MRYKFGAKNYNIATPLPICQGGNGYIEGGGGGYGGKWLYDTGSNQRL